MSKEETKSNDRTPNSSSAGIENSVSRSQPSRESKGKGKPKRKSVRFNDIQIRDYERTVGDNPSCSSGPPIW